jgi:predicted phosphodiesterase
LSDAHTIVLAAGVTRIAVISDVHANLPALQAAMAAIGQVAADAAVVCAGDIVGYYTEPNEVCELLRERAVPCIRGNHDAYVLGLLPYPAQREAKYRVVWTRDRLSDENMRWLAALPTQIQVEVAGSVAWSELQVRHASCIDEETYLYPDTAITDAWAGNERVLVLGHTHHAMVREARPGRLIVNPGSVGQPRDRQPGAAYAIVDAVHGSVLHRRAAYDVQRYQQRLLEAGIAEDMVALLSRTTSAEAAR